MDKLFQLKIITTPPRVSVFVIHLMVLAAHILSDMIWREGGKTVASPFECKKRVHYYI